MSTASLYSLFDKRKNCAVMLFVCFSAPPPQKNFQTARRKFQFSVTNLTTLTVSCCKTINFREENIIQAKLYQIFQ